MNTKVKNKIPKLRFPGFSGEWEKKSLGEIAEKIILKNKDSSIKDVLTNSATRGVVNQSDYFNKDIANQNNLENYYIVNKDNFVYNPRISIFAPVGPIKRNKLSKGVMSPLYSVFSLKNNESIDFIEFYFSTSNWHRYMNKISNFGARHDRMNITTEDFYKMPIAIPSFAEQEKIASFLSVVDGRIELLKKKKESFLKYKKGVMQKIFPKKGESVPEIRFGGFSGEWEEKKLGEVCSITTGGLDANAMVDSGKYRFYTCAKDYYRINDFAFNTEALLISGNGANVGYIHYYKGKFNAYQRTYVLDAFNENIFFIKSCLDRYLSNRINKEKKDGNTPYIVMGTLSGMKIQKPSIEEQQKIASFLTSLDNKIDNINKKLTQAEDFKKGLLQELFV